MVLALQGLLFGAFALGAAAIDLGIGSGGRTIQNFVREVSKQFVIFIYLNRADHLRRLRAHLC